MGKESRGKVRLSPIHGHICHHNNSSDSSSSNYTVTTIIGTMFTPMECSFAKSMENVSHVYVNRVDIPSLTHSHVLAMIEREKEKGENAKM